jgi:hypothetical protein
MEELTPPQHSNQALDVAGADAKKYLVEIEDREYPWPKPTIKVSEIRTLGGLPSDIPVIEVDPDNNERTLAEGEIVTLKPGHRFGKKVRYKRGFEDRMIAELELMRRYYPGAEWHPGASGGWVRLPGYVLPPGMWNVSLCEICFEVRRAYPGEAPYGFYVAGGLRVSGQRPQNYEEPATTPFPGIWGKFSWSFDAAWIPRADVASGSNLTSFVRSFQDRLIGGA